MLDYLSQQQLRRALVVGSGGGNDIVSAVLVAEALQAHGIQVDIAGILNPRFAHTFEGQGEQVINTITGNSRRFVLGKPLIECPYIDATLHDVLRDTRSKIGELFGLSLRHGSQGLTDALDDLSAKQKYDAIIGVDVGGDILGTPHDRVLSPLMDIATLVMLGRVRTKSYLIEMGLGADGELTGAQIDNVITDLQQTEGVVLSQEAITPRDQAVTYFSKLYKEQIAPIRAGNTGRRLLESFAADPQKGDVSFDYIDEYRVGANKWTHTRRAEMPQKYLHQAIIIDPKKLVSQRASTAPQTDSVFQLHMALKHAAPGWGSELDGQIIYSDNHWSTINACGESILLLTLPPSIPSSIRKEMIRSGLAMLTSDQVDYCLLPNTEYIDLPSTVHMLYMGKWKIVSKKVINADIFRDSIITC